MGFSFIDLFILFTQTSFSFLFYFFLSFFHFFLFFYSLRSTFL